MNLRDRIHALALTTGWKRRGLLALCGVMATLTLPPFFVWPLIIPAFSGLYLLLQTAGTPKRAFWAGWWWGMGFHVTGLYWFCIALLTDPAKFGWLIPFALLLVPAALSIYYGLGCLFFFRLRAKGVSGVFIFATVWAITEYLRGHLFGGFPWNLAGYAFAASTATLQVASLIGAYGLTWLAVLLGALPASLCEEGINVKRARLALIVAVIALVDLSAWGVWRLAAHEERFVDHVQFRLVQPNIEQQYRWEPGRQMANLAETSKLTQRPGLDDATYVIWPETAVPYILKPDSGLVHLLGSSIPEKAILITGGIRAEGEDPVSVYNSVLALDHDGDIIGSYDKSKLVPFGEFLPLRQFLPKFVTTPVGDTDFSTGPGPTTFKWGPVTISPLVCYEAIFPELAIDQQHRPQVMINITNDAWFGRSTGPYQHFQMARTRAVEQGIPLIRTANTGISAVIDSYGRIAAMRRLGKQAVLDVKLPVAQSSPTLYGRLGDTILLLVAIVSLVLKIRQKA